MLSTKSLSVICFVFFTLISSTQGQEVTFTFSGTGGAFDPNPFVSTDFRETWAVSALFDLSTCSGLDCSSGQVGPVDVVFSGGYVSTFEFASVFYESQSQAGVPGFFIGLGGFVSGDADTRLNIMIEGFGTDILNFSPGDDIQVGDLQSVSASIFDFDDGTVLAAGTVNRLTVTVPEPTGTSVLLMMATGILLKRQRSAT